MEENNRCFLTIDLPPDLEQDLIHQAAQSNIPRQTSIVQALRRRISRSKMAASQRSEVILSDRGIPDFPALESYRDEF